MMKTKATNVTKIHPNVGHLHQAFYSAVDGGCTVALITWRTRIVRVNLH